MIVRSMRLKNIKSYGEGPKGDGVTINFEPGTNRIAGKNGHGKTTLIESLGYALFLTEPVFEENFQIETYFLRTGKKAAEIDVTFGHRGEFFRIERGLGPNSRRQTKVVDLVNGSTCAEGAREVSGFLCRLFGLPDSKRFSELFWKLIGVRQGRLTWPFDSKPSAAKDYFEPLLDVAVFRECFQSLKPAVDEFMARLHEQERVRAAVEERIRERGDSAAALEVKRRRFKEIELQLQALNQVRENLLNRLAKLEAMEISLRAAEAQRNSAQNALGLARQHREIAERRMRESMEAAGVVAEVVSGYNCFETAESELQILRAKQAEQHRLEMELAEAEKKKVELEGKTSAAGSQADIFARQKQSKEEERAGIYERRAAIRIYLSGSQPEFDRQRNLEKSATQTLSDLRHFINSFTALLAHGETTLQKMREITAILASRDASILQSAQAQEATMSEALQSLRQHLAAASAERAALQKQLQQIEGGICPFLKEQCRQFDPSKVEGDLKEKGETIGDLERKRVTAEYTWRAAQSEYEKRRKEEQDLAGKSGQLGQMVLDFLSGFGRLEWGKTRHAVCRLRGWIQEIQPLPECPDPAGQSGETGSFESSYRQCADYLKELENWWQGTGILVQTRIDAVVEEENRRQSDQRDEVHYGDHLHRIEAEIGNLEWAENEQREAAAVCRRESAQLEQKITDLNQYRRAFALLGDQIAQLAQRQQRHRSDYQRYLGAKPLADERGAREMELDAQRKREERVAAELAFCESTLSQLRLGTAEVSLAAVRREFEEQSAAVAAESANLEHARQETEREEIRFREWQEACARRDEIVRILARLSAAIKLTELARVSLRDSAPLVAQNLCGRIAGQAQRIFNRINPDPVELRWEASPRYSLRVIPGDRRFAMLSGGEQTKLALAMTLAMIQEFSGLRFCVFDEPTYGVDAESREKLGDAMLEAQKVAELEQLILVSHDDAFDGKIENSIYLRKTAEGTEVVQFP
ncbi:MAG: SMC family ATPase [Verrucomicrobia bacterium]|nr:SMC family ATPase [Verrucomicrobiota bacterium]